MKNKIYKLHYCKDKLPEKDGVYFTNMGKIKHTQNGWIDTHGKFIDCWLEEVTPPTNEEIISSINEDFKDEYIQPSFLTACKWMRNKLFN